jgi:hypothetical protein
MQYDQHRAHKEALLEQAIHSSIETQSAIRLLGSVIRAIGYLLDRQPLNDQHDAVDGTMPEGKDDEYASDNSAFFQLCCWKIRNSCRNISTLSSNACIATRFCMFHLLEMVTPAASFVLAHCRLIYWICFTECPDWACCPKRAI